MKRRTIWIPVIAAMLLLGGISALSDARSRGLVENSLWLVAVTLAISIPIGTAIAVALGRTDARLRRIVAVALGIMLVVPLYLHAAGWEAGFGMSGWFTEVTAAPYQAGLLSGWRGAVWVHGMAAIPWMVLIVGTAVRFVEPELEEAALLDCSAWRVLLHVTLRRALPAIGVAAVWIAVGVATEMTVTDIFQTPGVGLRTYAEEIYTDFALGTDPGPPPGAAIGVAVTGVLAACGLMLCLAAASWTPPTARTPLVFRLGRSRGLVSLGLLLAAAAIFGVPLVSLIVKAGESVTHSAAGFSRGWSAAEGLKILVESPVRFRWEIGWSALIAVVAASGVLALAVPIGWIARRRDGIGLLVKVAAVSLSAAALAVPGPLVGIGLIKVFNAPGAVPLVNAQGPKTEAAPQAKPGKPDTVPLTTPRDYIAVVLNFLYDRTILVAAIGQAVRAFPLCMLIVWHALNTVPADLLEAAALDGAGAWTRLARIVLPLRWPALAFAWLAAFVVAIGELAATILVIPPGVTTLGVRISQLLHFNIQNELAGLCLILMAAAAVLAGTMVVLAGRSGTTERAQSPGNADERLL